MKSSLNCKQSAILKNATIFFLIKTNGSTPNRNDFYQELCKIETEFNSMPTAREVEDVGWEVWTGKGSMRVKMFKRSVATGQ